MVFLTGDTHGEYLQVEKICEKLQLTEEDILIILGDAGWNFYLDERDIQNKESLSKLKPTIFCVHGNHECRPEHIKSYNTKQYQGGLVWYEETYPNILFAKDGEIYDFEGKCCLVIGGAYSIDKEWRLLHRAGWWSDEQPSEIIKETVEKVCRTEKIDIILSHTCPKRYQPIDTFTTFISHSKVDDSTEKWLDYIEEIVDYKQWFCGHYHIDRKVDKLTFLYKGVDVFNEHNCK